MEIYIVMYRRYSAGSNLPVKAFEHKEAAEQLKNDLNEFNFDNDVFYSVEKCELERIS